MPDQIDPKAEVERIVKAARLLGVEVDENDAVQWLAAMAAAEQNPEELAVDETLGVFGHEITLLDLDPQVLERYRKIADIVQLPDLSNVETAISLSGSAAQGKIQRYPGDSDFFERVNIKAPTREEACRILGQVIRDKALDKLHGPDYELVEVKFGTWLEPVVIGEEQIKAKSPISWEATEVAAGKKIVKHADGTPWEVEWSYAYQDPGWCKIDWVVSDPQIGRLVHASNMLDVTWEAPDGSITPLDGFIDPYFQEVYLEAESLPLFTKLSRHISPQALQKYVAELEHQVVKYAKHDPQNMGKAAKRLYNVFRLTGKHREAAYIRELFDEPAALLYQVSALIDTLDEAANSGAAIEREMMIHQIDELMKEVIEVTEGPAETEIVMSLLRLRDDVSGLKSLGEEWGTVVKSSEENVNRLVNEWFSSRLLGMEEIRAYIEALED